MGHRREIFRPRPSREKIREGVQQALDSGQFDQAAQIAIVHYTKRATIQDFATALLATSEAISLAKELKWSRSLDDLTNMGISIAESKTEKRLNTFRRQTIFELVKKSLEDARRREESQ